MTRIDADELRRLAPPTGWALALAKSAADHASAAEYLAAAVEQLAAPFGDSGVCLLRGAEGAWETLAAAGDAGRPPRDVAADALDDPKRAASGKGWTMVALHPRGEGGEVLAVAGEHPEDALRIAAAALGVGLAAARKSAAQTRRNAQLKEILEIARQWGQTQEMAPLLVKMAEAATRLIDADRASIFLWDRYSHTLVGRPALGVEGGELRVPDDRGLVGRVFQTGRPGRVDPDHDAEVIDRQVDQELGYQTKTLVCVPLVGAAGERFGAFEVINKKHGLFTEVDQSVLGELAEHAAIALENAQQREALVAANRRHAAAAPTVQLIGESNSIAALRASIDRVAATDLSVLVLGENGTGKEVVSRAVHVGSARSEQPFIAVNCAAIAESLLESELFGHERGAFTDAHSSRQGKFELADGGTLFLDEIGDMSLAGQAKLLRVLEEKIVVRVGGSTPIRTDVRVIAATNQDLANLVRERRFREDLFYRLSVVTLELPPLRERADDVLLLANHFLDEFCRRARRPIPQISPAAARRLREHAWPGNVRELRNLMERIAFLSTNDPLGVEDVTLGASPARAAGGETVEIGLPLSQATDEFQVDYIRRNIDATGGNVSQAAERMGLHRSNLYRKMRQLGMAAKRPGEP